MIFSIPSAILFRALVLVAAATAWLSMPAAANAQLDLCLTADPPAITAPAHPLRFGITPQLAGTVGGGQGEVAPEDPARAMAELHALEPPRRRLVMRLNRLFESDGQAGIDRFAAIAEEYRRQGFAVESQIRYHPTPAQEGDMAAWEQFVRDATAALGSNPAVVALTITNEVNLPISANTSDGAYAGALDAIVVGVTAAREQLDARGRSDVELGFSYAYRYIPTEDLAFWDGIGQRATPEFRAALDHVGVQLYPGLFWPPAFLPGETAGSATIEGLTLLRDCYMPRAGLGDDVGIWVTEEGFATNLNRTLQRQVNDLTSAVEAIHAYSGTLNVSDFRYFNLRDNNSDGTDIFDAVGLLFDDYAQKPAFATYRDLIARLGREEADAAIPRANPSRRLTARCRGRGLRVRLAGDDQGLAGPVTFLARGKRVARDHRPPFSRTLPASRFGQAKRWRVGAKVGLSDGQLLKLRISKRRCSG